MRKLFIALAISAALAAGVWVQSGKGADAQGNAPGTKPATATKAEGATKRYEPIFEGWPKPKVALVFTGVQDGYIEPCGCSGKENQKGGLSRRDMLLKQLSDNKWPVVAMDAGSEIRRFGPQQELKYQATADALKMMGYKAVGFGPDDLRLSAAELFATVTPVGDQPSPFVSANVGIYAFDEATLPSFRVIEAGGKKIGVTSVLGAANAGGINNQDILLRSAEEGIQQVLPKLLAAKCDVLVLMVNGSKQNSIDLAKKFQDFDIVFSSGGYDEPPLQPTSVPETKKPTQLVEVGHKGMFATVLGFYDEAPRVRAQRVPLDARFGDSKRMTQVMASYQDLLKERGLSGLGLKPAEHSSGRQFIGSKECGECHSKAYNVWKNTPHAHALETLVNLDPQRQYDPECLSCHVTGWEPQKFTPLVGGYLSADKTPLLGGNGCENCHGPGSAHAAAERGDVKVNAAELKRLQREMQLTLKTPEGRKKAISNCLQCHDGDNSIEFKGGENFDAYWAKVAHAGKD